MNLFKLLFELFTIYMVYKLVFGFIIPVFKTTRQMKQKMAEMHEKMREQNSTTHSSTAMPRHAENPTSQKPFSSDYIEYEEIK